MTSDFKTINELDKKLEFYDSLATPEKRKAYSLIMFKISSEDCQLLIDTIKYEKIKSEKEAKQECLKMLEIPIDELIDFLQSEKVYYNGNIGIDNIIVHIEIMRKNMKQKLEGEKHE